MSKDTFEYGGCHFTPVRQFTKGEGDFFAISKRIETDRKLGLCTYKEWQKFPYSYDGFYAASTDKTCDIFLCEETGRLYVPGRNELFIYHAPDKQQKKSLSAALSSRKDPPTTPSPTPGRKKNGPER